MRRGKIDHWRGCCRLHVSGEKSFPCKNKGDKAWNVGGYGPCWEDKKSVRRTDDEPYICIGGGSVAVDCRKKTGGGGGAKTKKDNILRRSPKRQHKQGGRASDKEEWGNNKRAFNAGGKEKGKVVGGRARQYRGLGNDSASVGNQKNERGSIYGANMVQSVNEEKSRGIRREGGGLLKEQRDLRR